MQQYEGEILLTGSSCNMAWVRQEYKYINVEKINNVIREKKFRKS